MVDKATESLNYDIITYNTLYRLGQGIYIYIYVITYKGFFGVDVKRTFH